MGFFKKRERLPSSAEAMFSPSERVRVVQDALQRCGPSYTPVALVLTDQAIYVAMASVAYGFPCDAIDAFAFSPDPQDPRRVCVSFSHEGTSTGIKARVHQYGKVREVDWGRVSSNASLVGSEYVFPTRDREFVDALRELVRQNGGSEQPRRYAFETSFITREERGAFAAFSQSQITKAKLRLEADVAVAGVRLAKGRGAIVVGDEGIGWAINKVLSPVAGTIWWRQVGPVSRVDRSIQHGVSIKVMADDAITDLAIQTDTLSDRDRLLDLIAKYIEDRDRRIAESEAHKAAATASDRRQRPLTLDELKFLMVLWGGPPMFASDEPEGCEGEESDLVSKTDDETLADYPMGSLDAGPADEPCLGWPTYTFSFSVTTFCAEHCRLKIRELNTMAAEAEIQSRLDVAFANPDFPDDDAILEAIDWIGDED